MNHHGIGLHPFKGRMIAFMLAEAWLTEDDQPFMLGSRLDDLGPQRRAFLIGAIVAALILMSASVSHVIVDGNYSFHEGEYTGLYLNIKAYYSGQAPFPLLIHGAMDYVPSFLAAGLYGYDRIIGGTRILNCFIVLLVWILFLDLTIRLISRGTAGHGIAVWLPPLVLVMMAPRLNAPALEFHQAFLGTRDLFLLLCLWSFGRRLLARGESEALAFVTAGSVAAAFAIFWSYDRGLMAMVFLAVAFAGLAYERRFAQLAAGVAAFGFIVLLLDWTAVFGRVLENAATIQYWLRSSGEVFGRASSLWSAKQVPTLVSIGALLAAGFAAAVAILRCRRDIGAAGIFFVVGVLLVYAALLRSALNLPVGTRLTWAVWPTVILFCFFLPVSGFTIRFTIPTLNVVPRPTIAPTMFAGVFALLVVLFSPGIFPWSYSAFARSVIAPNMNAMILSESTNRLGAYLAEVGQRCVFGWLNDGTHAVIARRPFCTSVPYSRYVSRAAEVTFLQELERDDPPVIVVGLRGAEAEVALTRARLPNVDAHLRKAYPELVQIGDYTVARKAAGQAGR